MNIVIQSKRKKRKTNNYNEIKIIENSKIIFNKIKILLKKAKKEETMISAKRISDILIKAYSIDILFNFISYFGMEIYPNEMKYSLGYKFDSKLFFIIRNISNYISSKGNYLKKTDEIYGNTLLLIAASCWDYGRVINLLNKGYDIFKINNNGDSILHIICRGKFHDISEIVINKLSKISFKSYENKSILNNEYEKILNFIKKKNNNNKDCLNLINDLFIKQNIVSLVNKISNNLNSEKILIKKFIIDLKIILPKNIYSTKEYGCFKFDINKNLDDIKNIKLKLFINLLKNDLDKRGVFDINNDRVCGWGDSSGWILDRYNLGSQISSEDLKKLNNFILNSYHSNKFKLYFLDKNKKKVIIKNDNFSKILINSNLHYNNICIQKLYLEFDNDKFKNNDSIFGIDKSCLNYLSKKINENAINIFPLHVIKLHQKLICDKFIKNNDKKSLITIFIRQFMNIIYTDCNIFDTSSLKKLDIKCKITDIIHLINNLNNKITEKVKNKGFGSYVDLTKQHWIFDWKVNKNKEFYIFSSISDKIKNYLNNNKRNSPRFLKILNEYKNYQYYGLIAEFFNTWGCKFFKINDFENSKYLFEISNKLINKYFENYIEKISFICNYINCKCDPSINEFKNLWIKKNKIFIENLNSSISKLKNTKKLN